MHGLQQLDHAIDEHLVCFLSLHIVTMTCRREEESAERMRRALEYEEPDWVQAAEAGSCSSDGAAFIEDELYCIACDKFFKSDKALANHKRQVT